MNPFAGVPIGDYLRDAAALVFLLATLGKPWDVDGDGTDHWWVILSALLAVSSLGVPYLAKSGVVPGVGRDQAQLLKVGLSAPLLVSVLAAVVNDLVHATDFAEGGLGAGVALATAGALFAVQPRAADEDLAHRDDRHWWSVTSALVVAAVVAAVATPAAFVLRDLTGDAVLLDEPVTLMSLLVSPLLTVLALYGGAARDLVARHFQGVVVFAVAGLTTAGVALLTGDSPDRLFSAYLSFGTVTPVEHWDSLLGGVFLLSGAGALAASRPALRTARFDHPVTGWLHTARLSLVLTAAGSFLVPVSYVLGMVDGDEYPAAMIVAAILWVLAATIACVVVVQLSGATLNRLVVVVLTAAIPVIGIVLVAVVRSADVGAGVFSVTLYLESVSTGFLFTLPVLALCALTAPGPIRQAYGPLLPEREPVPPTGQNWPTQPPPQHWPAQPPVQPPAQQWPTPPPAQHQPPQPPPQPPTSS